MIHIVQSVDTARRGQALFRGFLLLYVRGRAVGRRLDRTFTRRTHGLLHPKVAETTGKGAVKASAVYQLTVLTVKVINTLCYVS